MTFLGKGESGMWITSEVEIPDELIDHLEQGKLVLFVGAGVSMQGKSNLPNFDDLVDEIAKKVNTLKNVKSLNHMIIILVKLRKRKTYIKLREMLFI